MLSMSAWSQSKEVISIYWPFSVQSHEYAEVMSLAEELSAQSKDHTFIVESKPGAGGSIALKALEVNKRAVVATVNGMYARPFLYRVNNYEVDDYTPIRVFCAAVPVGLYSTKKIGQKLQFNGTTLGSFSGVVSEHLKRAGVVGELVSYKGNPEAMIDVLNKTIDSAVDYLGPSSLARIQGTEVSILAITGTKNFGKYKTFSEIGVQGMDKLVTDFMLVGYKGNDRANVAVAEAMSKLRSEKAKGLCEAAHGTWYTPSAAFDPVKYHADNKVHAQNITKGIPPLD